MHHKLSIPYAVQPTLALDTNNISFDWQACRKSRGELLISAVEHSCRHVLSPLRRVTLLFGSNFMTVD